MIRWIKKLFINSTSDSVDEKKMHALSRISSPMPPKHMIYHENLSIERTSKLKQAFPPEYESCVIQRVLIKNPHWSLNACHWYMYE
ncbi:hypothetical protein AM501_09835 [Aneurinibacillus migulanus]|uniref:hypothetical protein n=1 Tax=Aneurinibacillus migulanus TaxID=47500 RepID=UPI0005BE5D05|nr:hypothetical protein [Aneurinibacillus migulanus]KIV56445.1 hypothetical protein TS64_09250 [Aneurinibacillus migulanus]KPD08453.1 hypothetical protein AM501_09835 [Aneurinibacillus migulanus]